MCVASCVPCHANKGLRHGATTHDCSCGIGITLRNSRICSNSHCETWTCHTAIAASLPECAMMSCWTSQCGLHLWLHPLVRPHYTCSCRTLIFTMVSKRGQVLGIVGPGVSSRQQDLSACIAYHVCAGVCAHCTCMPIHVCPSAHGTHGYDKPRLVLSTSVA